MAHIFVNQEGSAKNGLPLRRYCHVKRSSDLHEYGFYVYQPDSSPGHIIGIVDEGSPAERGGLLHGDKIIEVNDINVELKTHPEVIAIIKEMKYEIRLLVESKKEEDASSLYTWFKSLISPSLTNSPSHGSSCEHQLLD